MSKAGESIQAHDHRIYPMTADALAEHLEQFGQSPDKPLKFLGHGGKAVVYWLSNKKLIFKITEDASDAVSMGFLKVKPLKGFIRVHDVFKFRQQNKVFYGIVAEKLQEMSSSEKRMWNDFFNIIDSTSVEGEHLEFLSKDPGLGDLIEEIGLNSRWMKLFDNAYKNPDFQDRLDEKNLDICVKSMRVWAKGFDSLGIRWEDLHDENIMTRGRDYVLMDLGVSNAAGRLSLPEIDIPQYT